MQSVFKGYVGDYWVQPRHERTLKKEHPEAEVTYKEGTRLRSDKHSGELK